MLSNTPYVYILCRVEYSGVKPWLYSYTGCGERIGEQSGRVYTSTFVVSDWEEIWCYQHKKGFHL